MNANPDLITTPIVDRNGKKTTVRKKPQRASSRKTIPAPNLAAAEQRERKHLVKAILTRLESDEQHITARAEWSEEGTNITRHLSKELDSQYLRKVLDICAVMTQGMQINDILQLVRVLENNGKDTIRAMHAHINWISNHPGYITRFVMLHHALVVNRRVKPESDGTIPHIELHVEAQNRYNKQRFGTDGYAFAQQYEFNYPYMEMVEKHADHLDAWFDYREQRGLEENSMGISPIDEDDFAEYLKHHNLKDGWL